MQCEFCNSVLTSKYALKTHQKTVKKCLILQNKSLGLSYECKGCEKKFATQSIRAKHERCCPVIAEQSIARCERLVTELTIRDKIIEEQKSVIQQYIRFGLGSEARQNSSVGSDRA
jgi:hypothetical protein